MLDKSYIPHILRRGNQYLKNLKGDDEDVLCVIPSTLEEHNLCYSVCWCNEKELNYLPSQRTMYTGAGRLLISKISADVEFEGSLPRDWIFYFELKIQGLEGYYELRIRYERSKVSSLKRILNCTTSELLSQVDQDSVITLNLEDDWGVLRQEYIKNELDCIGIQNELTFKTKPLISV